MRVETRSSRTLAITDTVLRPSVARSGDVARKVRAPRRLERSYVRNARLVLASRNAVHLCVFSTKRGADSLVGAPLSSGILRFGTQDKPAGKQARRQDC